MPNLPIGRFTRLPGDGRIFVLACGFPSQGQSGAVFVSDDEGATWTPTAPFSSGGDLEATDSGAFLGTADGVLIAAFGNNAERKNWNWDPKQKDSPGAELPTCVIRSLDGGRTWQDLQQLHREWTGANRDMLQTRNGRIVLSSMKLLHNPGRHGVLTYWSDDNGATWEASNIIDLGGNGHHDGVTEGTLVELGDNSLLLYLRTPWGDFWRALSTDGGAHWHVYGPAGHGASNAPGFLERLADGRLVLLWNRQCPEGKSQWPLTGGDGNWSASPASNFRHELSIRFSDDDGATWSPPVVIARSPKGEISYPYLFEPSPGVLWITAPRFGFRACIQTKSGSVL
jgi:hypothetical protein